MALFDLFKKLQSSPNTLPGYIPIREENTDLKPGEVMPFIPMHHYFSIRVSEMFLSYKRKWFKEYDPMVFTLTEFQYDARNIEHPYIVGRSLIDAKFPALPNELIIRNTDVTGRHPYAGGNFTFTIILCQVTLNDYLQKSLKFIEKVSGLFSAGFVKALSKFLDASKLVMDALDDFFDNKSIVPIVGYRETYNENTFKPGYFILLDQPEDKYDPQKFYVKQRQLYYGDSIATATPFRGCGFVLYNIEQDVTRTYKELPFYKLFEDVLLFASQFPSLNDDDKKKITAKLMALELAIKQSPDVTEQHGQQLMNSFYNQVKEMTQPKYVLSKAKRAKISEDFWEKMEQQILSI